MKALFITILLFGAAFAAYDYFGMPPGQKVIFKALNAGVTPPSSTAATAAPSKSDSGIIVPPIPQDQPTSGAPTTSATPTVSVAPTADAPPAPVPEGHAQSDGFITPRYDTLEVLTKNWTFIPKTAFPRPVHLRKALPFKMSVGSSTLNAGATVTALAFENNMLTLSPTATSTARATAAVDDTDLKIVIAEGYERWKVVRTEWMKKAYDRRMANRSAAPDPGAPAGDPAVPPTRAADGTYPLLTQHLNSGEVNEIKLKNVKSWGDAVASQFEGKAAWAIKVGFEAETVFGLQPAEAQAIVSNGRVKGWFYTGSGEPVP